MYIFYRRKFYVKTIYLFEITLNKYKTNKLLLLNKTKHLMISLKKKIVKLVE